MTVVAVNLLMSLIILPRIDAGFLSEPSWGATSLGAVGGVWSVAVALFAGIASLIALNLNRLPGLRGTVDAGANASALPILSVASLVGFGAVVAAMPAFEVVRDWLLGLGGGPLVSLAVTVNVLAGLTGSASGGMTIALDALGPTFMAMAAKASINPELLHRVAVIGSGTLDSLPHNGAVVTMLALCGCTHRDQLSRHRHGGRCRSDPCAGRRHRARNRVRVFLMEGLAGAGVAAGRSAIRSCQKAPPRSVSGRPT